VIAIRSLLTYVVMALYVLVLGPPILLAAFMTKRPAILFGAGHIGVRLGLALSGVRMRVEGREHLQRNRAAVYAVNHTSNVEPPIIFDVLSPLFPRLKILYKAELRKLPVLVGAFDLAGFIPLERANRDQSRPAIDRAVEALRNGDSFLIFPEGTRSRTGELLPFKKGGFIMAIQAQAPIVPIAIVGARSAMKKGSAWIRPVTVSVRLGRPFETAGLTIEDRDLVVASVRNEVARLLQE
jgi:1-acyl-sn-glycerol-3-phosphate acyltransferase